MFVFSVCVGNGLLFYTYSHMVHGRLLTFGRRSILVTDFSMQAVDQNLNSFYFLNNSVKMSRFLPRNTTLARYTLWPCVRPSVCLSVCHEPAYYQNG